MDSHPEIKTSSSIAPSPHHYKLVGLVSGFFVSLMVIVGMFAAVGAAGFKYGLGGLAGLMIYGVPTLVAAPIIIIIAFFLGSRIDTAVKNGNSYQRPLLILDTVHDILGLLLGVIIASIFTFLILNGLSAADNYLNNIFDKFPILLPFMSVFSYTFPFLYFILYVYLGLKIARLFHPLSTETVPSQKITLKLISIFILTLIAPIILATLSYIGATQIKNLQNETKLADVTDSGFTVQVDPDNGPYTEISFMGNIYVPQDSNFGVLPKIEGPQYFGNYHIQSMALSNSKIIDAGFYLAKGWHRFQFTFGNDDCSGDPGKQVVPNKHSTPRLLSVNLTRIEKQQYTYDLTTSVKIRDFSESDFFQHCPRPLPTNPIFKRVIYSVLPQ